MSAQGTRRERILERLREIGADGPKRSLGQNFLISDHIVDRILFAAKSEPFTALIEVGPGLGAITEDLLQLEKPMTVIELDRRFAEMWRQREPTRLRVVEADALQLDWRELSLPPGTLFVSNLPYQISSSLVIERSLEPAGVTRMILMFQKEVAQRIGAVKGSKDYGLLTVIAQTFWETLKACDAGPGDFFPPPNVASRVMQFRRRKIDWLSESATAHGFLHFAKAAYSHRRKLLLRNLEGSYFGGDKSVASRLEALFEQQKIGRQARAEELDPQAFVRLYLAVVKEGLRSNHV